MVLNKSIHSLAFLAALTAFSLSAQTSAPSTRSSASTESAQTAATQTAATTATTAPAAPVDPAAYDSRQVRDELREVLERHPREVGITLKLEPSLFRDPNYMAAYPALSTFIQQHPEVAQNPQYYLESIWIPGDAQPESPQLRASREFLQGLTVLAVFIVVTATLIWLIRTLLDHRRWSHMVKVQTELRNKLLDRFTTHEDLLRYVQSTNGREFLDMASMPMPAVTQPVAGPLNRILWSVQVGVIITTIGIGLQIVSGYTHPDVARTMGTLGAIAVAAGIGFIASAVAGYFLSRKLGLLPPSASGDDAPNGTPRLEV